MTRQIDAPRTALYRPRSRMVGVVRPRRYRIVTERCEDVIYASAGDRVCGRPATLVLTYGTTGSPTLACCDDHALARLRIATDGAFVISIERYARYAEAADR